MDPMRLALPCPRILRRLRRSPLAPCRLARLAPYRLAPYRLAPYRLAPYRLAPYRLAPYRLAPYRLAPYRLARASLALLGLALSSLLASGCDSLVGEPPVDEPVEAPPETPPADELEARLRARGEEVAPYMVREGEAMRGEAPAGGARDFSRVLHPGWCYKVVGLGGEGVQDLDVRVYDPNSVLLQRDTTQDPEPHLGQMRPICPAESGTYRLEVRVSEGEGAFAVQLYRSI
jgi:hypothetical protein